MTPEEKSLLERTYKFSEENNVILKSLRRSHRLSLIGKSIYWFVIIGLSIGAFYFIQPYINFMTSTLGIGGDKNGADSAATTQAPQQNIAELLQDLLK